MRNCSSVALSGCGRDTFGGYQPGHVGNVFRHEADKVPVASKVLERPAGALREAQIEKCIGGVAAFIEKSEFHPVVRHTCDALELTFFGCLADQGGRLWRGLGDLRRPGGARDERQEGEQEPVREASISHTFIITRFE